MSAFTWPPERPRQAGAEPSASEPVAAAVLVPIHERDKMPYLVLTKRRSDLRRHAGEISFPGGRRDPEDSDLTETALREAEEEIGLERSRVSLLGELPPVSTFVTNYVIHPFVATIPDGLTWLPSEHEVEQVLELPIEEVSAARGKTTIERRGISFQTDAYLPGEHVIWGATARIIEHLLERLDISGPGVLRLRTADAEPA